MKTIITSKLLRKCLILAFMIIGLVFVVSSNRFSQPAAAAICCESCEGLGDPAQAPYDCLDTCFGVAKPDCYDNCVSNAQDCYNHCVYCYSSGPGGDCASSGDCPPNYFCGSENTCIHY